MGLTVPGLSKDYRASQACVARSVISGLSSSPQLPNPRKQYNTLVTLG